MCGLHDGEVYRKYGLHRNGRNDAVRRFVCVVEVKLGDVRTGCVGSAVRPVH
jgi:hypothetical protein